MGFQYWRERAPVESEYSLPDFAFPWLGQAEECRYVNEGKQMSHVQR